MMSAKDREGMITIAQAVERGEVIEGGTSPALARGLLAEHEEVIAAREKIGDMTREAQASTDRFVEAERRHVADLAAARGVTSRLRESITTGSTDEVQTMALADAAQGLLGAYITKGQWVAVCAAFIALHEEHKATRAELDALRNGIEVVLAVTPRS